MALIHLLDGYTLRLKRTRYADRQQCRIRLDELSLFKGATPLEHLVGVEPERTSNLSYARLRLHRQLHNVSLLRYRSPPADLTPGAHLLGITHAQMIIPAASLRQRDTPYAYDQSSARAAAHLAGQQVCADMEDASTRVSVHWCMLARGATPYLRQEITIRAGSAALPLAEVQLVDFKDGRAAVVGKVAGSPIVSGNFYFGFEHPLATSLVKSGEASSTLKRTLPLLPGQSITYSSVAGTARPGQLRRDFLAYLELERAHPYRTFLHYNTWYDLGQGNRFGAAQVLDRMHALGEQLVRKRAHSPAGSLEQRRDPAIPITTVLAGKQDDRLRECIFVFPPYCPIALRAARLVGQPACPALRHPMRLLCMSRCDSPSLRA